MATVDLPTEAFVWSLPEPELAEALATRPLLLLLHGRGSNERDLFALVPHLPAEAVVVSLRGPSEVGPGSYQWFRPTIVGSPEPGPANEAGAAILDWLDELPRAPKTWVLGFSQGAAMALQLMRLAPRRFDKYVNLSGFTIPGEMPLDDELLELRPPVFWGRDPQEQVVPQFAVERTEEWLPQRSRLTKREYEGIGHAVSGQELLEVTAFLRNTTAPDADSSA
ncbi:dienelactone hydrolase family protein [soil metagenome]